MTGHSWRGWHRREIFLLVKIYFYTTSNIDRLKINTHRNPDQELYKRMPFSCHTCAFHFCDMSLITACAIYFLSRNHLPPDKSENDQDSDSVIDLHVVFTYVCRHCFSSLQYLSHALEMTKFLLPNPWIVLFLIYPTFYSIKSLFTLSFSLRFYPRHK